MDNLPYPLTPTSSNNLACIFPSNFGQDGRQDIATNTFPVLWHGCLLDGACYCGLFLWSPAVIHYGTSHLYHCREKLTCENRSTFGTVRVRVLFCFFGESLMLCQGIKACFCVDHFSVHHKHTCPPQYSSNNNQETREGYGKHQIHAAIPDYSYPDQMCHVVSHKISCILHKNRWNNTRGSWHCPVRLRVRIAVNERAPSADVHLVLK